MLKCRREDINDVNNMFGTDITVDFSSAWLENHLESSINIISQLNEAGAVPDSTSAAPNGSGAVSGGDGNDGAVLGQDNNDLGQEGEEENGDTESSNNGTEQTDRGNGPDEDKSGESGQITEAHNSEVSGDGKDSSSGETDSEDGNTGDGGEVSDEEVNKVKEELVNDDLTFVEGVVEVVNEKVSQLIADARKGDLDD